MAKSVHLHQTKTAKGQSKDGLICRPLDTFIDITWFLEHPPAWRTLCKELTPHSTNKLKNLEIINRNIGDIRLEAPDPFCHFDPDAEDAPRYDEDTLPKTLVCHDMANGYHDDSYIEGTTNHAAYTFYNWAAIDIFCYFSHHFITIPPLSWINVAHEHGVKVIGTVITEWNEGVALWDKILSSETESSNFASKLVTIASTLKFDGWLLNVENKINSPDSLLNFVRTLHRMLHKELQHGVLIWYDSVTIKGNLNWQNQLNDQNKAFFDACDGIFTNYSWDQNDVQLSMEAAGKRIKDLYIGVDVWGRNFYGGGHLNTQEAVSVIHQFGCSVALFAPAWTHETLSMDPLDINGISMSEGLEKCDLFYLRDRALWGSLWPFLNTRVPCQLPFKSSFCRGMGRQRRMYGEVLCNAPWYNLRHQQYQPNSAHGPHGYLITSFEIILKKASDYKKASDNKERQKGILRYRDSFQSGTCLKIKDSIEDSRAWLIREEGISSNTKSVRDEDKKHGSDESKHVHGPSTQNDTRKSSEGSSDSDEDGKKKRPRHSSSGSTLLQNVKKVLMKLRRHKSLSELFGSTVSPPRSLSQSSANSPDQRLAESLDHNSKVSKDCPDRGADQSSDQNSVQLDNKEDDQQGKKKIVLKSESESLESEVAEGVVYENYRDEEEYRESMDAGPSVPLVARRPVGKSMQRMSIKIRLGTRQRRAYGLTRVPEEMECLEFWLEDSFNGGACLCIHPSDKASLAHRYTTRLLHCDFLCEPDMLLCVVTKTRPTSKQSLNILLRMKNAECLPLTVVLVGRDIPQGKAQDCAARGQLSVSPLTGDSLARLRLALLVEHPACYVPLHNDFGWTVRYYHLTLPGCRITSVCCHALLKDDPILLGHLAIVPLKNLSNTVQGFLASLTGSVL